MRRHKDGSFLLKNYEIIRRLGQGSFGRVDLVRERATGVERVCKVVNTMGMRPNMVELMRKEIRILRTLDHPYVVKIHEYCEDLDHFQLVFILEHIPGGDCEQYCKEHGGVLPETLVARLIRQLLVALDHCHEKHIVHRDIKPANMMLTKEELARSPNCKVIDFGLAANVRGTEEGTWGGSKYKQVLIERVGTPAYTAPEVVDREIAYTAKADMWSVGVTALELLTGTNPFLGEDVETTYSRIKAYRSPSEVLAGNAAGMTTGRRKLTAEACGFLEWLLQADLKKRPTAAEALAHPWLVQLKATGSGMAGKIAESISKYSRAPAAVRQCLCLIAAHSGRAEIAELDEAFSYLDFDFNGQVSQQALAAALGDTVGYGEDKVQIASLLQAAKLDSDSKISYTEIAAACLLSSVGSVMDIAKRAFSVLDKDESGQVCMDDLRRRFPEKRSSFLAALPKDKPVTLKEWVECVRVASGGSPGKVSKLRLCVAGARVMARAGGC